MIRSIVSLALGVLFAWLDTKLVESGVASWGFLRHLNGAGSGAFELYTAMLVALVLRIVAFVITLALVSPRASPGLTTEAVALLILVGSIAAFLALPTFGLSVLAFAMAEYYVFFVLAEGTPATEAILRSARIAAANMPGTFVLVVVPIVAAAGGEALARGVRVPAAATLAGWLLMEMTLVWGLSRASVAYDGRLHE